MRVTAFLVIVAAAFVGSSDVSQACQKCLQLPGEAPECVDGGPGREHCFAYHGCMFEGATCGGGGGCFLAGTMVETPRGAVAIELLRPGDDVIAVTDSGERQTAEIIDVHRVIVEEFLIINGKTKVTGDHPFRTASGWVIARDVEVGDQLASNQGFESVMTIERIQKGVRAYNLSVGGPHTFFADGHLVHNKIPDQSG